MKKCLKCNKDDFDNKDKFCDKCGSTLVKYSVNENNKNSKKIYNSTYLLYGIIIILIITLISSIVFLRQPNNINSNGEVNTKINNLKNNETINTTSASLPIQVQSEEDICNLAETEIWLIDAGYTCLDSNGKISLQIGRGAQDFDLEGLLVYIYVYGNSYTEKIYNNEGRIPGFNEERVITLQNLNYVNAHKISITPVVGIFNAQGISTPTECAMQSINLQRCL